MPRISVSSIALIVFFSQTMVGLSSAQDYGPTETTVGTTAPTPEAYREFAISHQGDPDRGRELFHTNRQINCVSCHSIDATKTGPGPNLSTIGDKFDRGRLIQAILEPSADIAIGYGTTIVVTDAGQTETGVLQRATDDWLELLNADAKLIRIPWEEVVASRASELSLMPAGVQNPLTLQGFADLVSYLETLQAPPLGAAAAAGAVDHIPLASRPAAFVPLFAENIRIEHPTWAGTVPGSPNHYIVLEQFGKAWLVTHSSQGDAQELLLDLSEEVRRGGATGLLGFAFHPRFPTDRRYYVKYQRDEEGKVVTVVEERSFVVDGLRDADQEPRMLLSMIGSTDVHSGGCIEFGPDGMLYIGMGDTGPQGDPGGHGQDLTTLLGKILRIDIEHADEGLPYAIPADNPFRSRAGVRPEIWAYGFREPWRFTFDPKNGDLWVGDVGQDKFEEVALVRRGENLGWNVFEGHAAFSDRYRRPDEEFVAPLLSYSRRLGVSITGGYVYRGTRASALTGWYVCADYESRRVWALLREEGKLAEAREIGRCPDRVASFMQDPAGELYAVGYDRGVLYHVDLSPVDLRQQELLTLAETAESGPIAWQFTQDRPAADWQYPDFDSSDWQTAPGGFGSAGTPGAIVRTEWRTSDLWLRREFNLSPGQLSDLNFYLRLHHDEDVEVYLNGKEITNLRGWTTTYQDFPVGEQIRAALQPGRNLLAVHCHQNSGGQYIDVGLVAEKSARGESVQ